MKNTTMYAFLFLLFSVSTCASASSFCVIETSAESVAQQTTNNALATHQRTSSMTSKAKNCVPTQAEMFHYLGLSPTQKEHAKPKAVSSICNDINNCVMQFAAMSAQLLAIETCSFSKISSAVAQRRVFEKQTNGNYVLIENFRQSTDECPYSW